MSDATTIGTTESPQQLTLLPASEVPIRFRLDTETRRLGLLQVAKMRELLTQRREAREAADGLHRLRPPSVQRDRAA